MTEPRLRYLPGDDRHAILAPGLRMTFVLDGDRWAHTVAVGGTTADLLIEIASTIEGDPARDQPGRVVSPAYQEIHPHAVGSEICVLLTGQSTPHHFSAVVTAWDEGSSVSIEVDIADRCRRPVEILAATYTVALASSDLADAGPGRIAWGGQGTSLPGGRLEFAGRGGTEVALAEAGRRATRVQALARPVAQTATHRLCYVWRWTSMSSGTGA
jgi:hypothetical protein